MMTIRRRTRLSALLFCLPVGLCVASTAVSAPNDDDEEWRDTKGPRGENVDKSSEDNSTSEKKTDAEEKSGPDESATSEAKPSGEGDPKSKKKAKVEAFTPATSVSFALLGTYGFSESLNGGLGIRGGGHMDGLLPLYFGGIAQYFFGSASQRKDLGDTIDNSYGFMYLGGEAGVHVEAATDLVLRPMVGLGLGVNRYKHCSTMNGCVSTSEIHPTITPGIVGLYSLGNFFFGADLRYLIVPGASKTSGALVSATVGVAF